MPFRIKICGVTNSEDASMIASVGADAIGFNFYEKSKRYIKPDVAAEIVKHSSPSMKHVGVFVNASSEAIAAIAERVGLDFVQLHGDEPPEFLTRLKNVQIIRAFRCTEDLQPVHDYLAACQTKPVAILLDAYDPNEYGGTGTSLDWPQIAGVSECIDEIPLILAGGLTPTNVAEAILQTHPRGVDTASGVEKKNPRHKDPRLCRAFVTAARSAFSSNP
jgi:phosphoribosylanthranilate isomerase